LPFKNQETAIAISPNRHTYSVSNKLNMIGTNEVFLFKYFKSREQLQ